MFQDQKVPEPSWGRVSLSSFCVGMCFFITSWEQLLLFYPEELFASAHVNIYLTTDLPSRWTKRRNKLSFSFSFFFLLHPLPLLGRLSRQSAHQPLPSNGHVEKDLCYFPLSLFKHHKWHVWVDESWCQPRLDAVSAAVEVFGKSMQTEIRRTFVCLTIPFMPQLSFVWPRWNQHHPSYSLCSFTTLGYYFPTCKWGDMGGGEGRLKMASHMTVRKLEMSFAGCSFSCRTPKASDSSASSKIKLHFCENAFSLSFHTVIVLKIIIWDVLIV